MFRNAITYRTASCSLRNAVYTYRTRGGRSQLKHNRVEFARLLHACNNYSELLPIIHYKWQCQAWVLRVVWLASYLHLHAATFAHMLLVVPTSDSSSSQSSEGCNCHSLFFFLLHEYYSHMLARMCLCAYQEGVVLTCIHGTFQCPTIMT